MPSDPVHKLAEDVAMEGPGQELPPGLPPGPGAGQEAQAQPRTEELVVKAFWNGGLLLLLEEEEKYLIELN